MKSYYPLSIITISCLGILIYSNTFFCPFHFDDVTSIVDNFDIKYINNLQNIWSFLPRRFILYLSIALNYHFNGLNVPGYHLFNLVVHLVSAILVWWLALLTFSTPLMKEEKIARHANAISLFAGLVFVSHPIQTEAVTYIVQRAASMATMFYLASVCLYVKSRLLQDKEIFLMQRIYYIGALLTAILAMFTKETAITLPLMILLYEFSFLKTKKSLNAGCFIPFFFTIFIIPVTMLLTETGAERLEQLRSEPGISSMHYLLTQFRVMVTYIRLVFLPIGQNIDYDYPIFKNIFELPVLTSFLFLMAVLYFAKRLFSKYRLVSFSIFWFFLTLLPESSFLPIKDVIFEHRLYLPLVGFSMFLVSSAYYIPQKNTLKMMVVMALLLIVSCYSVLTYQRNKVWRTDFNLWDDTVGKSPHKARPYNNRGLACYNMGKSVQAMSDYNKAIGLDPNYAAAYYNRGLDYAKQGKSVQAMSDYNKAIEIKHDDVDAYNNRGVLYNQQGNYTQAISDLTLAIAINPDDAKAYYNRGLAYQKQGNFAQAASDYNKSLEIDPNFAEVYNNRGFSYAKQGKFMKAIPYYNKAIEIDPDYAEAYNNRGFSYAKQGDFFHAISDYNKAIEIKPDYADAYNNRGIFYVHQGNFTQAISDLTQAVKKDPHDAMAYYNRGLIYAKRGNLSQAISDYNKAIQIKPDYLDAYYNRGLSHSRAKEFTQAVSDYNKDIEINPDDAQAYNNRAVLYYQLREYNKAWTDLHKAEELGVSINPEIIGALKAASGREQ